MMKAAILCALACTVSCAFGGTTPDRTRTVAGKEVKGGAPFKPVPMITLRNLKFYDATLVDGEEACSVVTGEVFSRCPWRDILVTINFNLFSDHHHQEVRSRGIGTVVVKRPGPGKATPFSGLLPARLPFRTLSGNDEPMQHRYTVSIDVVKFKADFKAQE